jgi:N-acylneuraminate cytidylyltransferase/CMP-N,N'-diacetyllegionaminic acid synthase
LKILFLITARSGSKGVPGKNLRKVGGLSLVGYKAIGALKSKYCDGVMISTDSLEIQEEARHHGVEVPFTRPSELATDEASSSGVVSHAMNWIETQTGDRYDAIMLLEPSTPFTQPSDYDRAVEIMQENDASLVVGMRETRVPTTEVGPMDQQGRITQIVDQVNSAGDTRRQALSKEYTMNGGLYLFKWDVFKEHGKIYADREKSFGHLMDPIHSVEIDEMIDLDWAEFLVEKARLDISGWQ